jgi:hypothetical protein
MTTTAVITAIPTSITFPSFPVHSTVIRVSTLDSGLVLFDIGTDARDTK